MAVNERTLALLLLSFAAVGADLHWTLAAILLMCLGCFLLGRSER